MELKLHGEAGKDLEKTVDQLWLSACELTFRLVEWGLVVALFRFLWKVTEKNIFYYTSTVLTFLMLMYITAYLKSNVDIEIFERPIESKWKWWVELLVVLIVGLGLLIGIVVAISAMVNAVTEAYPNL